MNNFASHFTATNVEVTFAEGFRAELARNVINDPTFQAEVERWVKGITADDLADLVTTAIKDDLADLVSDGIDGADMRGAIEDGIEAYDMTSVIESVIRDSDPDWLFGPMVTDMVNDRITEALDPIDMRIGKLEEAMSDLSELHIRLSRATDLH